MKYTLVDGLYLYVDKTMTVCPKMNPVPVPRQVKSNITHLARTDETVIDWKRFSCTTKCPFFELQNGEDGKLTATLHCMEIPRQLKDIEAFKIPDKKTQDKAVNLQID